MPRIAPLARLLRQAALPFLSLPVRAIPRTISPLSTLTRPLSFLTARPSLLSISTINAVPSQIRTLAYGAMYQPSQRKRKRKHGFLVRSKGGRLGRKTLANRRIRGRRFLSH